LETDQKTREADERLFFAGTAANCLPMPADNANAALYLPRKFSSHAIATQALEVARRFQIAAIASVDEELARGAAFLVAPVLMAAGALTYFSMQEEMPFRPLLLGLAALSAFLWLARNRYALKLVIAGGVLFVAGMLAGKLETWRTDTRMLGSPVTTSISGMVRAVEYQDDGRVRLLIDVAKTIRPKLRHPPERIRISARNIPEDMRPGSGISGVARLFPARGPLTPGGYDFAFQNYFDGIGANGFFLGEPQIEKPPAEAGLAPAAGDYVENVRLDIYRRITGVLPGETGEIAAALITGLKRGISEKTNEDLRRTGLAHILSISGLHMALAAGTVMGALRLCFAFFPGFASRHPVKKYSAAVAMLAGTAYLLISGGGVATQRSFIMLAIMLLALVHDHAAITMRNLAIAALVMIAVSPHDVAGPSFQMSYAATAALVAGYAAWTEFRFRREAKKSRSRQSRLTILVSTPLRYVGGLALTSVIAGSATALYAAYNFHRIAPLGLPANLAALPIFSTLVMPPAVVSMVLMPFDLEAPALHVMGFGISLVADVANWFAQHTAGDVTGLIPASGLACATIALVILVVSTTVWRVAAIPFILASAVLISQRRLPDVMVSEDAGLIAVRTGSGSLAVNTPRPNAFIIEDWEKASSTRNWNAPESMKANSATPPKDTFACKDGLCLIGIGMAYSVAYVSDSQRLGDACARANIIVIADPTVKAECREQDRILLTAKRLALYGTAFLYIGDKDKMPVWGFLGGIPGSGPRSGSTGPPSASGGEIITIQQAIVSIDRQWNRERIYLRHARGLPERK